MLESTEEEAGQWLSCFYLVPEHQLATRKHYLKLYHLKYSFIVTHFNIRMALSQACEAGH
jgi:hypothetical protein